MRVPVRFGERNPSGKSKPPGGAAPPGQDARPASRLTVLLVDDVADSRDMYALYFSQVGVQIVTANDGQAALAAVKEQRPDIVVLDLAMPGLSGWDVLRLLRSDLETRDIPVLVLSGQRAREDALRSGADGYCEKPCLPDRLFGEIIRVLHGGH